MLVLFLPILSNDFQFGVGVKNWVVGLSKIHTSIVNALLNIVLEVRLNHHRIMLKNNQRLVLFNTFCP